MLCSMAISCVMLLPEVVSISPVIVEFAPERKAFSAVVP